MLLLGGIGGAIGWLTWRKLQFTPFLPFWLNLLWLFDPTVDLLRSRLILLATFWLFGFLAMQKLWGERFRSRWVNLGWLIAGILPIYLLTMPQFVGQADSFEFQVVTPKLGVVHPTGYPLYLLLGKFFSTLLPDWRSFAWQLNFVTMGYGVAALCLVFLISYALTQERPLALFSAVALGLTPTFWSQVIEAEVYSLHLLIVAGIFYLIIKTIQNQTEPLVTPFFSLFFLLGLGLTNHLTTFLLLPALLLLLLFQRRQLPISQPKFWLKLGLVTALPLLLYAYLPLRWQAVNHEPMGVARFFDWVTGVQFAGALRWGAWLQDSARYGVVGRLLSAEWGWLGLLGAGIGWVGIWQKQRQFAILLFVTWLAFIFYCLNYYVPDLAVFLLPAQLIITVCIGVMPAFLLEQSYRLKLIETRRQPILMLIFLVGIGLLLVQTPTTWEQVARVNDDGLTGWGKAVLDLPLADGATILADGEKIAPLLYLQQAEGVRPDLRLMVLPDEAAYRAVLDRGLAEGKTVYLARFLPALESIYHLRSAGALLQVSDEPLTSLPATVTPINLTIKKLLLRGYDWQTVSPYSAEYASLTLYWQLVDGAVAGNDAIYLRWQMGENVGNPTPSVGALPANNSYPVPAWKGDEIVADWHHLPRPNVNSRQEVAVQVAVAPQFAPASSLDWQTILTVPFEPADNVVTAWQPVRLQLGKQVITGVQFPAQTRQVGILPVNVQVANGDVSSVGVRIGSADLVVAQVGEGNIGILNAGISQLPPGKHDVMLFAPQQGAQCGWLGRRETGCMVGQVEIVGAKVPAGATNFADKIALTRVDVPDEPLSPGGQLTIHLDWVALAPIAEDYTVFVQLLDENERIVGQSDAYPVQGTFPTSQWGVGEQVSESVTLQLDGEMPAGTYRLYVGFYLLATSERLPVLDNAGNPINDKTVLLGLQVR